MSRLKKIVKPGTETEFRLFRVKVIEDRSWQGTESKSFTIEDYSLNLNVEKIIKKLHKEISK